MSKAKMSPDGLARCRSMVIEELEDGLRHEIRIYDPKLPGKVIARQIVRTEHDRQRYFRSWMKLYRIPRENITQLKVTVEKTQEQDNDAKTDERTT